jgi:hypothetical protein
MRLLAAFVVGATLALPCAALATTLVPLDLPSLTARAERVVLARVERQEAHWTDGRNAIYTDVVLRIERTYKGDVKAGDEIVVRREGGTVDGVAMVVYGAPTFVDGEEVLLFSERRGSASWVVGMTQGKLRVARDAATGKKLVRPPDLSKVELLPNAPRRPIAEARPLEEVEAEIRKLVAATPSGNKP